MMFSGFVHVVACLSTSFPLNAEKYFIVGIYHILFISGKIFGLFPIFFWLLWIILLWTPVNKVLCGHVFSTLLDVYLGAELLGHMLVLCLTFWGTARMFSKGATPFYIPTVMYEFSNLLIYFLAILVKFCLFYSKHLSGEVTCLPHHG